MNQRNHQIYLGGAIVVVGVLALIATLTGFNPWRLFWPLVLIGLGLYFVLRPRLGGEGVAVQARLFGDVERRGRWPVQDEELWMAIGDTKLDLTEAEIPSGETRLRLFGLIGDIDLRLPADVGLAVESYGFVTAAKLLGHKQDMFLSGRYATDGYAEAERRIHVQTGFFIADVDVQRA
ncbi:MAG: cell wall-active antibiotics response protein LiaF [Chloroflexota bacterium]